MIDFSSLPSYQIVIKSFRRFKCLKLTVDSILKYYPDASIIIADDSFENPNDLPEIAQAIKAIPNVQWLQLDFNIGLPAGRNTAVLMATADVIVMCDDDFVFTSETRIENLLTILAERPEIGVAAGCVRFDGINAKGWHCLMNWNKGGSLTSLPLNSRWQNSNGVRHRVTDLALNWYAARREVLVEIPWDEQFKVVMEHLDHFMLMKSAGIKIHYTPDSVVGHEQRSPEDYGDFRTQNADAYTDAFLKKWGVTNRLGFAMQPEEDLRPIIPQAGRSVLVFGVGHSGTTIVTKMIESLGFCAHNADDEYRENKFVRDLNQECLDEECLNVPMARRELAYMEQASDGPWVLKDPRFIHTLEHWQDVFSVYQPLMVFVTRDLADVAESFKRRDEGGSGDTVITRGLTLDDAYRQAAHQYDRWPWAKVKVDLSQIGEAVSLFDQLRP